MENISSLLAHLAVEVGDQELGALGKALRLDRGDKLGVREGSRRQRDVGCALRGFGEVLRSYALNGRTSSILYPSRSSMFLPSSTVTIGAPATTVTATRPR